jgi:NADPH:quinone reductase-like Zn-dependent oxidoreductase
MFIICPVTLTMSQAVVRHSFGGTDSLSLIETEIPVPGSEEVRVRITVAGLNPSDWQAAQSPELAALFGLTLPTGFGNDFAGIVDGVGDRVTTWKVGDRVFGGARGAAVADYALVSATSRSIHRTPDGVDDLVAGVLDIAGRTAGAVMDVLALTAADTVLIVGAGGGVGSLVTQLAVRAGARVLGTGAPDSVQYIRSLGAEPVRYGDGLIDQLHRIAPAGITAAADLFGVETAVAAIACGAQPNRIVTIEAPNPPSGVVARNGSDARSGTLLELLHLVETGELRPSAVTTFALAEFRQAVDLQRSRHVKGKAAVVTDAFVSKA